MPFMFSLMRLEMSTGPPFSNSMPWHTHAPQTRHAMHAMRCYAVLCGAVRWSPRGGGAP